MHAVPPIPTSLRGTMHWLLFANQFNSKYLKINFIGSQHNFIKVMLLYILYINNTFIQPNLCLIKDHLFLELSRTSLSRKLAIYYNNRNIIMIHFKPGKKKSVYYIPISQHQKRPKVMKAYSAWNTILTIELKDFLFTF